MGGRKKAKGITMADVVHNRGSSSSSNASVSQPIQYHPYGSSFQPQTRAPQVGRMHSQSQASSENLSTYHTTSSGASTSTNSMDESNAIRGPARPSNKWNTHNKHLVNFTEDGEIEGPDEESLNSNLGILARNGHGVPLTYPSWTEMPKHVLDDLWREVQANTNLPNEAREKILSSIGTKWKNWKYRVKLMYLKNKDNFEELLKLPDDRIDSQQWRTLISYWGREEIQVIAKRNKDNRGKLHFPHRTGRTNFKNIKKKMEAEGLDTSLVDLFCFTREPAKDEDTRHLIAQLKESLSQIPEDEQTETLKNKVWVEHMGVDTRGHVRRVGKYTPSTDKHISIRDRHTIVQEIRKEMEQQLRVEIVEEVREEVLQQVKEKTSQELKEEIRAEVRAEFSSQLEYMQQTISFLMTHLDVDALAMPPGWVFGTFSGRQGPTGSTTQRG